MQWTINKSSQNVANSDSLLHYGVLGMKWGIRKDRDVTIRNSNTGNKKDRWITTDVGVAKVDIFDLDRFDEDRWFLDYLKENLSQRYAPYEDAQKALENLPKYTARLNPTTEQVTATNHNRYDNMRTNNCFLCSMAYEMRRRGYNVQAKESASGGWSAEVLHCFGVKDAFTLSMTPDKGVSSKYDLAKECYKQLEEQCLSYGNGARGCLGIQYYNYDSGHSMAWIVENGEFKIVDSQGMTRGSSNGYEIFLNAETVDKDVEVYRLDNARVLPGVTDFVEPFEATQEEKALAAQKKNAKTLNEAQLDKKIVEAVDRIGTQKLSQQEENVKKGKGIVSSIIGKVKEVASDLVKKGKALFDKIFNIKTVTRVNGEKVD